LKQAVLGLVLLGGLGTLPVFAQSQADFVNAFSGKWQVYEQRLAAGTGLCQLDFSSHADGAHMGLTASNCAAPLASAAAWAIEGSQLVVYDAENKPVVKLGGNQKRVTGMAGDVPIILERAGGDGTAAMLQAAYNASGCYYLGYSQTCAPRSALAEPAPAPDGRMQIELLADLSVHSEPRSDADVVGTAQKGSCVAVDSCTMASDGPWCRASFGKTSGWLRKLTMRQNRWPVVTYVNSCTAK
jgi:hypothetical protein